MMYILAIALISTVNADCIIDIRNQLNTNEPSFFHPKNQSTLWIPKNYQLKWKTGESSRISCSTPGSRENLLTIDGKEYNDAIAQITCVSGNRFKTELTGNRIVKSNDLSCEMPNFGDVRKLKEKCGANETGQIVQIGFTNGKYFSPIIRSCFNSNTSSVLYTSHYLYGDSLSGEIRNRQPNFRQTGTNVKLASYSQANQVKMFTKLLGNTLGPRYFEASGKQKTGNYLAIGHLAPTGDEIFNSWRTAAFSLANAIPQWQLNNGGNWALLEQNIRELAMGNKTEFFVITGTYETAKLPNEKNETVDMYLGSEPGKVIIPKWIWKIVQSSVSKDAIMFMLFNEVQLDGEPLIQPPCQDVCNTTKWGSYKGNHIRGVIFCCNVQDVMWVKDVLPSFKYSGQTLEYKIRTARA